MEDILDEVMELFPSKMNSYRRRRGNENPLAPVPDCRARMRREGLQSEDETAEVAGAGDRRLSGGKGQGNHRLERCAFRRTLPPHFIVQQWAQGEEATRAFLAGGGRVIHSDTRVMYFDYPYGRIDVKKIWQSPQIPDWAKDMKTSCSERNAPCGRNG